MSDTGIVYPAPALLIKISRLDNLTEAAIEESDNTSRVMVSMPRLQMFRLRGIAGCGVDM